MDRKYQPNQTRASPIDKEWVKERGIKGVR